MSALSAESDQVHHPCQSHLLCVRACVHFVSHLSFVPSVPTDTLFLIFPLLPFLLSLVVFPLSQTFLFPISRSFLNHSLTVAPSCSHLTHHSCHTCHTEWLPPVDCDVYHCKLSLSPCFSPPFSFLFLLSFSSPHFCCSFFSSSPDFLHQSFLSTPVHLSFLALFLAP